MVDQLVPGLSSVDGIPGLQLMLSTQHTIPYVWPNIEPLLLQDTRAWNEYFTLESLRERLMEGSMQLWTLSNEEEYILAMITEFRQFPKINVVNILWIGGESLDKALGFLEIFEWNARKSGADKIVGFGRKGFLRTLREREKGSFEKDLISMTEH
jgi:hypothetical protein